jgi:hypothetical protein
MRPILTTRAAVVLLATALPVAAFGQATPPPQTPPSTAAQPPAGTAAQPPATDRATHHARPRENPTARVEARIAQLHSELKITPEQQAQWDQFAQVMRENASAMGEALTERAAKIKTMNAVESMQSYAHLAEVHDQSMQKLTTAFQALYGTLSAAQKQAADQAFRPRARTRD